MATNNPISAINFNNWVSPSDNIANYEGVLLAQYLKGGYQNVITLEDRDAIPIYNEGTQEQHIGFTNSGDGGKTTGRRSLGMMVHVIDPNGDGSEEPKTYILLPFGYFGNRNDNGDSLGWDSWSSLPEWEKAKRMKPSATVYTDQVAGGPPPLPVEYLLPESQTEDDCWFELVHPIELPSGGSEGQVLTKIDNLDYNVQWSDPQGGSDDGIQGAQGDEGIQGAQGDEGIQGAQGDEGIQGAQGDEGIQGAQGDEGIQGAQGDEGIQGAQGDEGIQGAQGDEGIQGAQGEPGNDGQPGSIGPQGLTGIQGAQGSLGPDGDQGIQGAQGDDGIQGAQGAPGIPGSAADQGAQGDDGIQGAQGDDGIQGAQGDDGIQGAQGDDGIQGAQGDDGIQGAQGDDGIQGAQGDDGIQGAQGDDGIQGAQGEPGSAADQGIQGAQGDDGIQGAQGDDGIQGAQGEPGSAADQGIQGAQGDDGIQGAQGDDGIQGAQGDDGVQGAQGDDGIQGAQGDDGIQGAQGDDGIQGAQGATGTGDQGAQGADGASANCIPVSGGAVGDQASTDVISTTAPQFTNQSAVWISNTIQGSNMVSYLAACEGTGLMILKVSEQGNPNQFVVFTIDTTSGGQIQSTGIGFLYTYTSFSGTLTAITQFTDYCIDITCYGADGDQGAQGAPGSGGGGGTGVYVVKLEYSASSLIQNPFIAAEAPDGTNLIGLAGWTFTRATANTVYINHPEGKNGVEFTVHTQLTGNRYVSKAISGQTQTLNSVVQLDTKDYIEFNALNNQIGVSNNTQYVYLTWVFPDNDFFL